MSQPRRITDWACCALACCALLPAALAGPLADPTRPPAALAAPGGLAAAALPPKMNRDTARAIAAAARAAEPPPPAAPVVVQSVQLHSHGSAVAMVDGRLVKPGDMVDGRSVLAIDAHGLLLKGPRGPERVWLLGSATKQAAGSITQSQTARYQAAPGPGQPAAGTATAVRPALPGGGPGGTPVGLPGEAATDATLPDAAERPRAAPAHNAQTTAAPAPLSLAKRTAP